MLPLAEQQPAQGPTVQAPQPWRWPSPSMAHVLRGSRGKGEDLSALESAPDALAQESWLRLWLRQPECLCPLCVNSQLSKKIQLVGWMQKLWNLYPDRSPTCPPHSSGVIFDPFGRSQIPPWPGQAGQTEWTGDAIGMCVYVCVGPSN
jgi:hypothetical protein